MITFNASPEEIPVGSTCKVLIGLVNSGSKPVYHVDVRFRFPSGLAHLRGSKIISVPKLNPGQGQQAIMSLKARRQGTHTISLRASSFKDAYGRTHPLQTSLTIESVSASTEQQASHHVDSGGTRVEERTALRKQFMVFISYAQRGNPGVTGRLYDRLVSAFGSEHVFFDQNYRVNPPGKAFPTSIKRGIFESQVVLLLVDDLWKQKVYIRPSSEGCASNENSWLRIEAEFALHSNCDCIPVLLGGTTDLDRDKLPSNLRPLVDMQYMRLRFDRDFERDVNDIISETKQRSRL